MKGIKIDNIKILNSYKRGATGIPFYGIVIGSMAMGALVLGAFNWVTSAKPVQQACFDADGSIFGYAVDCNALAFQMAGGAGAVPSNGIPTAKMQLIENLYVTAQEQHTNSYTAINSSASLKFYGENTDPTDADANAIDTLTFAGGTANSTAKRLYTSQNYNIVFDGGDQWYSWKQKMNIPFSNYNDNTGVTGIAFTEIMNPDKMPVDIGTISVTMALDGTETGYVQTNSSGSEAIVYNYTSGDGAFCVVATIKNSEANSEIRNLVYKAVSDQDNPLEGNEFSSVTWQHDSGTNWFQRGMAGSSSLLNKITSEQEVHLGNAVGQESGSVKICYAVTTGNLANNEQLHQYFDDLGDYRGKSILPNNIGATAIDWDITFVV